MRVSMSVNPEEVFLTHRRMHVTGRYVTVGAVSDRALFYKDGQCENSLKSPRSETAPTVEDPFVATIAKNCR